MGDLESGYADYNANNGIISEWLETMTGFNQNNHEWLMNSSQKAQTAKHQAAGIATSFVIVMRNNLKIHSWSSRSPHRPMSFHELATHKLADPFEKLQFGLHCIPRGLLISIAFVYILLSYFLTQATATEISPGQLVLISILDEAANSHPIFKILVYSLNIIWFVFTFSAFYHYQRKTKERAYQVPGFSMEYFDNLQCQFIAIGIELAVIQTLLNYENIVKWSILVIIYCFLWALLEYHWLPRYSLEWCDKWLMEYFGAEIIIDHDLRELYKAFIRDNPSGTNELPRISYRIQNLKGLS